MDHNLKRRAAGLSRPAVSGSQNKDVVANVVNVEKQNKTSRQKVTVRVWERRRGLFVAAVTFDFRFFFFFRYLTFPVL